MGNEEGILSPIEIGNFKVKNRIAMASMGNHLHAPDGSLTQEFIDYLSRRAEGGTGLIFSPFTAVSPGHPTPGVYSDRLISDLSKLCKSIQTEGAKLVLQISHLGGQLPEDPISPSAYDSKFYKDIFSIPEKMPRELTVEEIERYQKDFVEAAKRAQIAGFDAVELHGGYSYLGAEFISPHFNKRDDRFGGSLENRLRFFTEILEDIKSECGDKFTVGVQYNGFEKVEDGLRTSDAVEIGRYMEDRGIDFLHPVSMSWGSYLSSVPPIYVEANTLVEISSAVKDTVDVPVVAEGGIRNLSDAEKVIDNGQGDIASIGRALIADPDLVKKAEKGELITPCIRCNVCHTHEVLEGKPVRCSVNPVAGKERKYREEPCLKDRKVVVVGGGPAGMEAARVLDNRGFQVTLFEELDELGGHLRLGCLPEFKEEIRDLLTYYRKKIDESDVEVNLNHQIKPEDLEKVDAWAIILATGSKAIIPDIEGIEDVQYETSIDILEKVKEAGRSTMESLGKVTILGAGLVGSETALLLGRNGVEVNLIDQLSREEIMPEEHPSNKRSLLEMIEDCDSIEFTDELEVDRIEDGDIFVSGKEDENSIPFDTLLISVGLEPRRELRNHLEEKSPPEQIRVVGDCKSTRRIYEAMQEANSAARDIRCS